MLIQRKYAYPVRRLNFVEPLQSGDREHDGIKIAVRQPPKPRIDVAAQRLDLQIGAF